MCCCLFFDIVVCGVLTVGVARWCALLVAVVADAVMCYLLVSCDA